MNELLLNFTLPVILASVEIPMIFPSIDPLTLEVGPPIYY